MEHELDQVIQAILFALGREISVLELSETLKIEINKIEQAMEQLKEKYDEKQAITLMCMNDKYQLVTNKKFYPYLSLFVENSKKQTLSISALETLSIIAYNPKITKTQIEKIRGVNSDFSVHKLLECGLIEEIARLNIPGRPAIYSVTNQFLKDCNIKVLEELPNYSEIKIMDEQIMIEELSETKGENA